MVFKSLIFFLAVALFCGGPALAGAHKRAMTRSQADTHAQPKGEPVVKQLHLETRGLNLLEGVNEPQPAELRFPSSPLGPVVARAGSASTNEFELMLDPERGWSNTFRNQARVPFSVTLLPVRF